MYIFMYLKSSVLVSRQFVHTPSIPLLTMYNNNQYRQFIKLIRALWHSSNTYMVITARILWLIAQYVLYSRANVRQTLYQADLIHLWMFHLNMQFLYFWCYWVHFKSCRPQVLAMYETPVHVPTKTMIYLSLDNNDYKSKWT